MATLITGAGGFIGFHTAKALLEKGEHVLGIDNLNDYYDPQLKTARLAMLANEKNFSFAEIDIADMKAVSDYAFKIVGSPALSRALRHVITAWENMNETTLDNGEYMKELTAREGAD